MKNINLKLIKSTTTPEKVSLRNAHEAGDSFGHEWNPLSIIVHSHLRWDFVWQRPQQIFSRLAAHHPILFAEEPIWAEGEPRLNISEPQANIVRVVPVLPPPESMSIDAQCELISPLLMHALKEHPLLAEKFTSHVQWFYSPMTAPNFLGRFGGVGVVYDCMDELANFRFAPADITEREQFLLSKADVVFTGGYHLFHAKSLYHDNVHFFGCGVDVAHYARARAGHTPLPAEVADLSGPIAGYFGVIDERLDYELLRYLARNWATGTIVMIGPVAKIEPEMLPRESNIVWLGQRSYSDLPAFLKAFDVCLMPFALNETTQYINPTKTLEYMAAGKPIVSTAVPDVERNFTPIVEVVRSHEAFVVAVKQALESPRLDLINEGVQRANGASWEAIVSAMRGHMLNALNKTEARPRHSAFT